jgi:hypothetical protein
VYGVFRSFCIVPQIKDGKLDQDFAVNEVRKGLEDEGVEFELKDLEETIASCATKSKKYSAL